jgi:hypothetical protein
MTKPNQSIPRTVWAEHSVEEFLSLPLISEFVFRSPQTVNATQREVVDFLIAHGNIGILISQKCQEDPTSHDAARTEFWVRKKAKDARSQLCGALRTGAARPIWCDHPRRGRVEFSKGLPKIDRGIVLVEAFQTVDLQAEAAEGIKCSSALWVNQPFKAIWQAAASSVAPCITLPEPGNPSSSR